MTGRILSLAEQAFKGVERPNGFRELIIKFGKAAYVVRYRVTDEGVIVTRIWHSLQNRPR